MAGNHPSWSAARARLRGRHRATAVCRRSQGVRGRVHRDGLQTAGKRLVLRMAGHRDRCHGRGAGGADPVPEASRGPRRRAGAPRRATRARAGVQRTVLEPAAGGRARLRGRGDRTGRHAPDAGGGAGTPRHEAGEPPVPAALELATLRQNRRMLLDGRRILVTGVLNDSSIAVGVARRAQEEGAEVVLTSFGRVMSLTQRAAKRLPSPPEIVELDVSNSEDVDALAERVGGRLDGVLQAIGFGPQSCLRGGYLTATTEDVP